MTTASTAILTMNNEGKSSFLAWRSAVGPRSRSPSPSECLNRSCQDISLLINEDEDGDACLSTV